MKAKRIPPRMILVYAQVSAYILAAALMFVLYLIGRLALFQASIPDGMGKTLTLLLVLIGGTALSALQNTGLRKWFPQRVDWVVLSGLAVLLMAAFVGWLLDPLVLPSPGPSNWLGAQFAWTAQGEAIGQWSLASGFVAGLLGGLLFGMLQAALLPSQFPAWHRRLWWGISALAWAFAAALLLAAVNTATVAAGTVAAGGGW